MVMVMVTVIVTVMVMVEGRPTYNSAVTGSIKLS
jgi:hypothetical protein